MSLRIASKNAREIEFDAPRLLGLPAGECDRVDMFIHAHQRKAQLRLARIAFRIAFDEAPSDPNTYQRGGSRVDERGPHHVARDRERPAGDMEDESTRNSPQDIDEGDQQNRGLQQTDPEVGG